MLRADDRSGCLRHREREDRPPRRQWFLAGLEECAVDDVDEPLGAGFDADCGDGRRNRRFEAGPIKAAQDTKVTRRFIPFDDEPPV